MNTRTSFHIAIAILALCLAGVANANTVITAPNVNSPADVVYTVTSFNTTGATQATLGLVVTVHFSDGSNSGPVAWVTNVGGCTSASGCGQASGAAGNGTWTLTVTGNTGTVSNPLNPDGSALVPWTFTNTSTNLAIASVDLNGGSLIAFDRDLSSGGGIGTPGSAGGIDYEFHSESGANSPFTVTATYSRILQLFGTAQPCQNSSGGTATTGPFAGKDTSTGCGDEWGSLKFAFTAGGPFEATGAGNAVWSFFQDTDQIGTPEPLTFGLTGAGLLALAAFRRRRITAGPSR